MYATCVSNVLATFSSDILSYKAIFIAEQTNLVDGNRIWHMGQRHHICVLTLSPAS